jgi:hypothetical protein
MSDPALVQQLACVWLVFSYGLAMLPCLLLLLFYLGAGSLNFSFQIVATGINSQHQLVTGIVDDSYCGLGLLIHLRQN